MSDEVEEVRANLSLLEMQLRAAGAVVMGKKVKCPFHEDRHPSAGIYSKDNVWRFHCHACKIDEDYFGVKSRVEKTTYGAAIGATCPKPRDDGEHKPRVFETIEAMTASLVNLNDSYLYTNPDTQKIDLIVYRQELPGGGKKFIQASRCDGGFWMKRPPGLLPLFNRTAVRGSELVIVVEGEKCVKAMRNFRFNATTSPMGSTNAKHADWSPLAGKDVVIFRDNDSPGEGYQNDVIEILKSLPTPPKRIRFVDVGAFNIPDKGDCVEFFQEWAENGDVEEGRRMMFAAIDTSRPVESLAEFRQFVEEIISGKRMAVPFRWKELSKQTKALMPGKVVCICGDPDAGKSLLILESVWNWLDAGVKACAFFLEDDRAEHMLRATAQIYGVSEITDDDWARENPELIRGAIKESEAKLIELEKAITVAPEGGIALADLAIWVERKASEGNRIIIVDPVSIATVSDKPWQDDKLFLIGCKAAVRRYGASLILVTHPRINSKGKPNLNDISGGAAYPRFSHCVLWLRKYWPKQKKTIKSMMGNFQAEIDRAIHIVKARHGPGGGSDIGFIFDSASLRYGEQGLIVKDQPNVGNE